MTPCAEVAVAFASALVEGDFARAHSMLAPKLRHQLLPETLGNEFFAMFRGYASGEPRKIHFDEEGQMEAWPAKLPDDVGWVYVGIEGDDFLEAVTVVVADIDGKLLVRNVEWGRP